MRLVQASRGHLTATPWLTGRCRTTLWALILETAQVAGHASSLEAWQPKRPSTAVAVILAVTTSEIGGDGWESNPPRTPQQRPGQAAAGIFGPVAK